MLCKLTHLCSMNDPRTRGNALDVSPHKRPRSEFVEHEVTMVFLSIKGDSVMYWTAELVGWTFDLDSVFLAPSRPRSPFSEL